MSTRLASNEIALQRAYYAETAEKYDEMHVENNEGHAFAMQFFLSIIRELGVQSILDVGSGTGRALFEVKERIPHVKVIGIEPSPELRGIGHSKGLAHDELIDGDAMKLDFPDASIDLVCEFGALHHIPRPSEAVSEMLRVAKTAIFISDTNNFGQGSRLSRLMKQTLNAARLWPLADWLKTKGKGYTITAGDGLAYSYSVFTDFPKIRAACASVHLMNTKNAGPDLYRQAPTVAILGLKRKGAIRGKQKSI